MMEACCSNQPTGKKMHAASTPVRAEAVAARFGTTVLQEDGSIENWTPGPGTWRVLRIGYTTQLSSTGGGLQCDKLSADAARVVFDSWFGEFLRRVPESSRFIKVLNVDSWEGGSQNWSPLLAREFRTRRGYDLLPYLPAVSGRIMGSVEVTERFLWDLRQTVQELILENHAAHLKELARRTGAAVVAAKAFKVGTGAAKSWFGSLTGKQRALVVIVAAVVVIVPV